MFVESLNRVNLIKTKSLEINIIYLKTQENSRINSFSYYNFNIKI